MKKLVVVDIFFFKPGYYLKFFIVNPSFQQSKNGCKVTRFTIGDPGFKKRIEIQSHELFDEINTKLFQAELEIMSKAVSEFPNVRPVAQEEIPVDYLRKRTPDDSKIDPHQPIADQFNLLRVSDPNRYPAFFEFLGKKYYIEIKKSLDE